MEKIIYLVSALLVSFIIHKISFRAGLKRGLRSNASTIPVAKIHCMFKPKKFWKVIKVNQSLGTKTYEIVPAGEGFTCLKPLIVDHAHVSQHNYSDEPIEEGATYSIVLKRDRKYFLDGHEKDYGIHLLFKRA